MVKVIVGIRVMAIEINVSTDIRIYESCIGKFLDYQSVRQHL